MERNIPRWLIALAIGAGIVLFFVGFVTLIQFIIIGWPKTEAEQKATCLQLQTAGLYDETKWDDTFGCLYRIRLGSAHSTWSRVYSWDLNTRK